LARGAKMHKKVFVDANVILDLFDTNRPFYEDSLFVLQELIENDEVEIFVSSDMISNIFYILKNSFKLGFDKSLDAIEKITQIYTIHSVSAEDIEDAIEISKRHIFRDYEDVLQYVSASREECSLIITNNPKDFKNSSIYTATTRELSRLWKI